MLGPSTMPTGYLGLLPHPAIGVRLPDIVIPPILKAFKDYNVAGGFMLSYNRETAPEDVIRSTDPKMVLYGHTGTSIREYITRARYYADLYNTYIEIEADHVSLMASPERAIKRIAGAAFESGLTDEEIENSMKYIEKELKEASNVGGIDFVTIDTCELIDLRVDKLSSEDVLKEYEERIDRDIRKSLESRYLNRTFKFIGRDYVVYIKYRLETIARLALKYLSSIEYAVKLSKFVKEVLGKNVGIEVSLDEVPQITKPEEMLFYINELVVRGLEPDYIAPNIGFKKREDYVGNLDELKSVIRPLYTIAKSYGVLLSLHSGSGTHPYSDKGIGVWEAIREATGGLVKYKMSGVYIQLLLEVMSRAPQGSRARKLYEEIYDTVYEYLKNVVSKKLPLYTPELEKMIRDYENKCSRDPTYTRNPRADFFRHYFFVFQCIRDSRGIRYLRERVLELFEEDEDLRKMYMREAYELTRRLILKLGFENNIIRYRKFIIES